MKYLFISLMENVWGGSEELWSKTAKYSLESGDFVAISINYPEESSKILDLINNGADVIKRSHKSQSILARILRRLLRFEYDQGDWGILKTTKFDHILISFGGAYDIQAYKELQRLLLLKKLNYSIIQQYNRENIFLDNHERYELREFFSNAANVFFVSERNKLTTERNLVCKLSNSKIISNPAKNHEVFNSSNHLPSLDVLRFGCVARFDVGIKNQDMLIQVFASQNWKNRNFELNLYGKGPGYEYLNELVSFYGLVDKVKFRGHVSVIEDVWMDNHCMLLASSSEGSPLSIIEAMYCSRPIIATNVGGNLELIDNTCGFIIPGVDILSLANTLEEVWLKKEQLNEMGRNSYNRIRSIHNRDSHKEIYKSMAIM
jgi:glycosyltransferase involved in cell wall biosynthesis